MFIARLGMWLLLTSVVSSCATAERKLLATQASLAHHEHLQRYESACRLKPSGLDTFDFECAGTAPVTIRCAVAGASECCWVLDANDPEREDQKCAARRVATGPKHRPH